MNISLVSKTSLKTSHTACISQGSLEKENGQNEYILQRILLDWLIDYGLGSPIMAALTVERLRTGSYWVQHTQFRTLNGSVVLIGHWRSGRFLGSR